MAIFERKFERKVLIDDTETLSCTIETFQTINGHTVSECLENSFFWFIRLHM